MGRPTIAVGRDTQPEGAESITRGRAYTRLSGPWLVAARIGWVAVALTVLVLNVVTIPADYPWPLPADVLRDLHQLGMSPVLFVTIFIAENAGYTLVYLAMGALIFWRRSDDRMALFCSLMLILFGGVAASPLNDAISGTIPAPVGSSPILVALVHGLVVLGETAFIMFFYLFPSGRFVPRWTRWLPWLVLAYWTAALISPSLTSGNFSILVPAFIATGAGVQIYRYRRVSTSVEREQTKWVVFGIALAATIIGVFALILVLLPPSLQQSATTSPVFSTLVFGLPWIVGLGLVPIFIAIAILRSRLWDIDVIIRRTLIYGTLTGALAAVYFAMVLGAQMLSERFAGHMSPPAWLIVVTTLLIAALFNPLRRGIQAVIDRRFYRRRYDAARTVEAFAATLRTELDLAQLQEHLVGVVEETMQPTHLTLWLRPRGGSEERR
jgi:uncharacterized membrane protein